MPREIEARSILNKKKHRDPWFLDDYTLNPYSGCSFNCLFCYIRGSKYGEHMERKLAVKTNAVELLDKQLAWRAKKGQYGVIVLSSATDPYLQLERKLRLTRNLLEVILKHRFPLHMITRSDLVTRDFDLLKEIEKAAILPSGLEQKTDRKVFVTFSFSTIDDDVARIFEPGATPPSKRLEAVRAALDNGLYTGVSMMPMLPHISDTAENLETMFATFKNVGAKYLLPATLTLFGNGPADSKTLVLNAIAKHYPQLLEKYQRWFGGSDQMPSNYRNAFGKKMKEMSSKYGIKDRIVDL